MCLPSENLKNFRYQVLCPVEANQNYISMTAHNISNSEDKLLKLRLFRHIDILNNFKATPMKYKSYKDEQKVTSKGRLQLKLYLKSKLKIDIQRSCSIRYRWNSLQLITLLWRSST